MCIEEKICFENSSTGEDVLNFYFFDIQMTKDRWSIGLQKYSISQSK
jgi:hypothetical protein